MSGSFVKRLSVRGPGCLPLFKSNTKVFVFRFPSLVVIAILACGCGHNPFQTKRGRETYEFIAIAPYFNLRKFLPGFAYCDWYFNGLTFDDHYGYNNKNVPKILQQMFDYKPKKANLHGFDASSVGWLLTEFGGF